MTFRELPAAQILEEEILHRVEIGVLIRAHRGVYRVGPTANTLEARFMAAVKACGDGASLRCRAGP